MASEQEGWVPVREETFTYLLPTSHGDASKLLSERGGAAIRLPRAWLFGPYHSLDGYFIEHRKSQRLSIGNHASR